MLNSMTLINAVFVLVAIVEPAGSQIGKGLTLLNEELLVLRDVLIKTLVPFNEKAIMPHTLAAPMLLIKKDGPPPNCALSTFHTLPEGTV
jgi:hypothetical protein